MSRPLASLAPADLRALAAALRQKRLRPPYTAAGDVVHASLAPDVARELARLGEAGCSPDGLAAVCESFLAAQAHADPMVELVATAPDGTAPTRDTAVVLRGLFQQATRSVLVAGFAVYQGQEVFATLAAQMRELPGLEVRMFLEIARVPGDTSLDTEIVKRFLHRFKTEQWPPGAPEPKIFYDPRALSPDRAHRSALHAKCVVVDGAQSLVTSANFTQAAQQRNLELGLLVASPALAEQITSFFDSLTAAGHLLPAGF
ncbi:MAG: DISARM system phospholipase D-like protein DrmC [Terriglobales bacterium]